MMKSNRGNNRTLPEDWQWTPEILDRAMSGNYKLYDPCVVCGEDFRQCPHPVHVTEAVIYHARNMTPAERNRVRNGEKP